MKKIYYIFAIIAFTLTSCDKNENSLESITTPRKATANAEELILSNAEKTIELQNNILAKADSVLGKMNVKANINGIQKAKTMSNAADSVIIGKLDSLTEVFKNQRPKAVERLFDEDSIPSGLAENDQYIIVGDDNMIDKSDPDNALMLSNIVRVSKGMEPIEDTSQKVKNIFKSKNGFTTSDDKRWPSGKVEYQFDSSFDESDRTFIRNCYNDWHVASGDKITFTEVPNDLWNNFLYTIGLKSFVKILKADLPQGTLGVGNGCGKRGWAWIKYGRYYINNYRTIVHEMGHTLGLQHEHQRPDRDNYLTVNIAGSQFDKIEEKYAHFLWWSWKTRSVTYSSTYDYMSIMHYVNGYDSSIGNYWFTNKSGGNLTTGGTTISTLDAEFIKTLY
jgi:hypothetical protein